MNALELTVKLRHFHDKGTLRWRIHKPIPSDLHLQDPAADDCLFWVKQACSTLGWSLSDNYGDWDYWHCISNTGGLFRFSFKYLLEKLDEAASTGKTGV